MNDIQIIEKPEWVTWEQIHEVIWKAHELNREKGINMTHAALSGKEIEEYLTPNGRMYVAIDGDKVIGTAAYKEEKAKFWFGEGIYAYCCFASVLPGYTGKGVYKQLMEIREQNALVNGIDKLMFNTHPNNSRVINVALKSGFKRVSFISGVNNSWVYLVKWINGAPFSDARLSVMYNGIRILRESKHMISFITKSKKGK